MAFIELEGWWTIVAPSDGIVEDNGVGSVIASNSYAIKRLVFRVGSGGRAVSAVVEIADRERFKPCCGVRFLVMNEFAGCGELATKAAWNLIDHRGGVV